MEMFIAHLPMVYIFRSLFVLREYVIPVTSTTETNLSCLVILKQGYQYNEIPKVFSKFYRSYSDS